MEKLLVLLLLPAVVLGQCFSPNDQDLQPGQGDLKILYQGEQQFAIDFLNALNKANPKENIFFSPLSIYSALLLAYFPAAGNTEEGLKKILHIPDSQAKLNIAKAYRLEKVLQGIKRNTSTDYELLTANQLFVSDKLKPRDCMKEFFQDDIKLTDFQTNPQAAVNMINQWVANQTKDNIKDLLSSDALTPATNLVLANCAYFKGMWKNKFPPEATRKEVFYVSKVESTLVQMMKQKSTFNYLVSENLGAHILEMPYKGDDVSIFFLLPPFESPSGITNVLERMKTYNFQKLSDELIQRQVEVTIPKFEIEIETKIIEHLKNLGVGDLFDSSSDLSGLTGKDEVKLDDAVHKAKISVDEEGTTAAAATAIFNFRSSRPLDPVAFNANHPFVYVLFNRATSTVLFAGVFNKPPPS